MCSSVGFCCWVNFEIRILDVHIYSVVTWSGERLLNFPISSCSIGNPRCFPGRTWQYWESTKGEKIVFKILKKFFQLQFIKRRSSVVDISKIGCGLASRLRFLGENWSFCQEISFWEDFVNVRLSLECRWIGKLWVCQLSSNFDIEPKKVLHPHCQSGDI